MPDYITMFCDMCDNGRDLSDAPWEEFMTAVAEIMFEHMTLEDAPEIH